MTGWLTERQSVVGLEVHPILVTIMGLACGAYLSPSRPTGPSGDHPRSNPFRPIRDLDHGPLPADSGQIGLADQRRQVGWAVG